MASNRQRQRKSRYFWGKLRTISHNNLRLENDWLGSRYDVNKFGIEASLDQAQGGLERSRILRRQFIEELVSEGWRMEGGIETDVTLRSEEYVGGYIHVSRVQMMPTGEAKFKVGVQ